ncbi:lasso peptide isopeptide bond-forming cyclase [Streptomyces sp. NPDC058257]|uniref:lasso peptide isopeptide bond-forming cyclase n=1 Tax=Streptomyces sp. NPDC058257 TaxID=3346409 RepID=UPI0036F02892
MPTGFFVLPDVRRSALPFQAPRVLTHRSGLPWVAGSWPSGELVQADAGPVRVAVIGFCPVTPTRLAQLAERVRTLSDVDALARALPGSFHLVALVHGRIRVQGSVTGLRQIFHTCVDGLPVAADRAGPLAALTGADIDEQALATRVACGGLLPPPLNERSMWSGVSAVPPDHCLIMDEITTREVRWWQPPPADVPLEAGAAQVRDALHTATADRHGTQGGLSADLSGGMDSTTLCFLAARDDPELITFRWEEAETGNDDAVFARLAAHSLRRARHVVVPQRELPTVFADPDGAVDTEQPYPFGRTLARMRFTADTLAAHGSRHHLAGHGGDELFYGFPGYLHRLLRRRPLTALRHLRGYSALHRWPLAPTVAELARDNSVATWWRDQADHLTAPSPQGRRPSLGWGVAPLRAPAWVTSHAADTAREALRRTAQEMTPLAADRGQHQTLLALRTTAPAYRQFSRLFTPAGIQLHQPFLDDRVVEAALAVRLHERTSPWRYKPLLAESMRGTVPDAILSRSTKGDFSADLRVGWRRNLGTLVDLFADSALADLGLIDPGLLRTQLLSSQAGLHRDIAVEHLLGCENWLRTARATRTPSGEPCV